MYDVCMYVCMYVQDVCIKLLSYNILFHLIITIMFLAVAGYVISIHIMLACRHETLSCQI